MKRAIFIGQAMPRVKRHPHDWPSLNAWLKEIDITLDQIKLYFLYTALVDYFPGSINGSHRVPKINEIQRERTRLIKTLVKFDPEIVVPIGKLSLSHCLSQKIDKLDNYIGNIFQIDPYQVFGKDLLVIPLPHPSGASTWRHKPENKLLLIKALELLKVHLT